MLMESNTEEGEEGTPQKGETSLTKGNHRRKMSAKGSTLKVDADSQRKIATISTPVKGAERPGTERPPVQQKSISEVTNGMKPKYLCHNIWDPTSDFSPTTSDWTLTTKPLKGPPQSTLDDETVTKTLNEHPDLFKIVTPICIDNFEAYLTTHPNRPFIESVCRGLLEGFWPCATTPIPGYPTINNKSKQTPKDKKKAEFLRAQ